jgi:hypothetical protein
MSVSIKRSEFIFYDIRDKNNIYSRAKIKNTKILRGASRKYFIEFCFKKVAENKNLNVK